MAKELLPHLVGLAGKKVAQITKNDGIDLEDAFEEYKGKLENKGSKMVSNYDFDGAKAQIIKKAKENLSDKEKKLAKVSKKVKKKKKKKKKKKGSEDDPDIQMISTPVGKKPKYLKPELVKVDGKAKLVKDDDEGYYVEKLPETKAVGLKCPDGSSPKPIGPDENRAGCAPD